MSQSFFRLLNSIAPSLSQKALEYILEILYLFSRRINLGPIEKDTSISDLEIQMVDEFSKNIDMQDIGLFWQLTIKTIDDLKVIGNENLTLEMYIMQLVHLKSLDEKEEIKSKIEDSFKDKENFSQKKIEDRNEETSSSNGVKSQLKNTNQIKKNPLKSSDNLNDIGKIEITSFQDLIIQATKEKEIELKYDLERNVKLVSFNRGKIDISFNEKLNKNFIKTLAEKLLQWTNERWIISLSKNTEAKSIFEKNLETKKKQIDNFNNSETAKEIKKAFPDAELIDFQDGD